MHHTAIAAHPQSPIDCVTLASNANPQCAPQVCLTPDCLPIANLDSAYLVALTQSVRVVVRDLQHSLMTLLSPSFCPFCNFFFYSLLSASHFSESCVPVFISLIHMYSCPVFLLGFVPGGGGARSKGLPVSFNDRRGVCEDKAERGGQRVKEGWESRRFCQRQDRTKLIFRLQNYIHSYMLI
jgi:hypothetical protein